MKRLFSGIFVAFACCTTLCAGNNKNCDNWHIMSGYGYSLMLGNMVGEGYSSVNSFVWQPNSYWGFGLEYGMNYHNPVDYSLQRDYDYQGTTINYQYTRRHNNFFVGPSMYWYPVNTQKHRVHIGEVSIISTPMTLTNIENLTQITNNTFQSVVKRLSLIP